MSKMKKKKELTKMIWWTALGVVVFCIALRIVLVGDFERPINLSEYQEKVVKISGKKAVEESATKTTYLIGLEINNNTTEIEVGKRDYTSLSTEDSIYILVSHDDIQLGTKEHPYTVIKTQE